MSKLEEFSALVSEITSEIKEREINKGLQEFLTINFSPESRVFSELSALCRAGMKEGWLGKYEADGLRYGRVIKPTDLTDGFSVDVVLMTDAKGPYHTHPTGEVDMVMPIDDRAIFDGQGLGWKVYSPGSGHYPTVRNGAAIVLYLLPNGEIEFNKPA